MAKSGQGLSRLPIYCALLHFLFAVGFTTAQADTGKSGNNRIIKWVDEKGVTHYSDGIPPQYSGRDNAEINTQGVVIKRNKPITQQGDMVDEELANQKSQEQKRYDRSLLASYTTAQEIDLARDRHLQMDEISIQGLQQRKDSETKRLAASKKLVEGFIQRKKPIPPKLHKT